MGPSRTVQKTIISDRQIESSRESDSSSVITSRESDSSPLIHQSTPRVKRFVIVAWTVHAFHRLKRFVVNHSSINRSRDAIHHQSLSSIDIAQSDSSSSVSDQSNHRVKSDSSSSRERFTRVIA